MDDLPGSALEVLKREIIRLCGPEATKFEIRFVELYFERILHELRWLRERPVDEERRETKIRNLFTALMPIPQAQFYCHDPLQPRTFIPENNFRVDFAFWNGTTFIAVEIDGREPDGYAADVRRDRLLRRAGVDVIHILNSEIMGSWSTPSRSSEHCCHARYSKTRKGLVSPRTSLMTTSRSKARG